MLHTKFPGNRSAGSGREDFLKVFTIYGLGGHLGHVTWTIYINFCSPIPISVHMKFGYDWSSGFGGEDFLNTVDDGQTTADAGAWVYYKSNRKAMNRNWSNQKANPALKTKAGNK